MRLRRGGRTKRPDARPPAPVPPRGGSGLAPLGGTGGPRRKCDDDQRPTTRRSRDPALRPRDVLFSVPTRRFCFGKTKFVLGWFLSTSSLPGFWSGGAFRAQFGAREFRNRDLRFGTGNRAGRRNAAWGRLECGRKGAGGAKNLESGALRPATLQPLEIPQNRQSFLWKSFGENNLRFEKAWRKAWRLP